VYERASYNAERDVGMSKTKMGTANPEMPVSTLNTTTLIRQ